MESLERFAKATGILLLATTIVVALAVVLVKATDFVLLIFLGILLGVFLTKTSALAGRYLPVGYSWRLGLVTSLLLALLIGGFFLFGTRIQDRLQAMSEKLDEGVQEAVAKLRDYPLASRALERVPFAQDLLRDVKKAAGAEAGGSATGGEEDEPATDDASSAAKATADAASTSDRAGDANGDDSTSGGASSTPSAGLMQSAAGKAVSVLNRIFKTTLGLLANIGVIFFVGLFLAVNPTLYRDGFARLFPLGRRPRVKEVLDKMSDALFSWLMGRFMTMLITGGGTAVALLALQVPLAISVGVVTGLLTFVPNIGAIIALALAMLLALPQGLSTVGWVLVVYSALQLLESNVITPLLQQHQTSIPPALLISFQVIMGALAGFLGLMVATPLLAATLVLVEEAWIKDVLGEPEGDA